MGTVPRGRLYWSFWETVSSTIQLVFARRLRSGPMVGHLEALMASHFDVNDLVATSRARVSLQLLLNHLGARPGDQILLSPITIRPMLDVVVGLGLVPLYCDLCEDNMIFGEEALKLAVLHKPKFSLLTPLFGISANTGPLLKILKTAGCTSIIDVSQTADTYFRGLGVWDGADYGIASLSALKTVDSFGGGLLFSPQGHPLEKLRTKVDALPMPPKKVVLLAALRNCLYALYATPLVCGLAVTFFATVNVFSPGWLMRQSGGRRLGVRSGLPVALVSQYSDFQASLAIKAFRRRPKLVLRRKLLARELRSVVSGLNTSEIFVPETDDVSGSDFWQVLVYVSKPQEFQKFLWKYGIDSGSTSLSFLPGASPDGGEKVALPVARKIHAGSLFLPMHPLFRQSAVSSLFDALADLEATEGEGKVSP